MGKGQGVYQKLWWMEGGQGKSLHQYFEEFGKKS